jgi:RNA polymerase sigma factor (sigma-70 family)
VEEHKIANSALAQLTERELEIIRLIAEGLSNKEIGEKLFISHRTVDTHRTNLMSKIEVHNVAGIVKFAITNGLLD